MPMDLIEIEHDLKSLQPIISRIVAGSLNETEFRRALIDLTGRLWHTIDHLKSLNRSLQKIR
jgi:hypothetical protein